MGVLIYTGAPTDRHAPSRGSACLAPLDDSHPRPAGRTRGQTRWTAAPTTKHKSPPDPSLVSVFVAVFVFWALLLLPLLLPFGCLSLALELRQQLPFWTAPTVVAADSAPVRAGDRLLGCQGPLDRREGQLRSRERPWTGSLSRRLQSLSGGVVWRIITL